MKIAVFILIALILFFLFKAFSHLYKGNTSGKMEKALTIRVALSIVLVLILFIGYKAGYIVPNNPNF